MKKKKVMPERELAALVENAKIICMTPEDQEQQRRSFGYGNANIDNEAVTRAVVDEVAEELAREAAREDSLPHLDGAGTKGRTAVWPASD